MSHRATIRLVGVTAAAALAVPGVVVPMAYAEGPAPAASHQLAPTPQSEGYPRQNSLVEPPADPDDASIKLGLTPYHAIAPKLNELQSMSQRVSAEVLGQTVTGREVYLVTLTAPESAAESK